jgi:CheY-like chemotaxis protein
MLVKADGSRVRILVVDDDQDFADSMVIILNCYGFQTVASYSSQEALAIASNQPQDIVMLDVAMPRSDGYQLARGLRALPQMGNALLICITGYGTEKDREAAYEAGCNYHFLKPFEWPDLMTVLKKSF